MKIVRIWLYKTVEGIQNDGCKPSKTNTLVIKDVIGYFVYYLLDGEKPTKSTRKEADQWSLLTGQKVETLRGYPAFMIDRGYRI